MKKAPFYTFDIFFGYNAFGCIHILLTLKDKSKNFPFTNSYILGICSWMVFLSISEKTHETFILTWILFFRFPVKSVLWLMAPFHGEHHIYRHFLSKFQFLVSFSDWKVARQSTEICNFVQADRSLLWQKTRPHWQSHAVWQRRCNIAHYNQTALITDGCPLRQTALCMS